MGRDWTESKHRNLHPQKWDFQICSPQHRHPYGFKNMRGRFKSMADDWRISLWWNWSSQGKKGILILDTLIMQYEVHHQGLPCTGMPSRVAGALLLAAGLQSLALWLSQRFVQLLSGLPQNLFCLKHPEEILNNEKWNAIQTLKLQSSLICPYIQTARTCIVKQTNKKD